MSFSESTVGEVKSLAKEFFREKIFTQDVDYETVKEKYPWHNIFFKPEGVVAAVKERSVVTSIGQVFVPQLAEIVAQERYSEVYLDYEIEFKQDNGRRDKINRICKELRGDIETDPRRRPDDKHEMEEIKRNSTGDTIGNRLIADLYIEDFEEGPLFLEIKSPKPNLDQTEEAKRKILTFRSSTDSGKAFFALHYNPYRSKRDYDWSYTKQIMDLSNQVLVGKEMWNYIGKDGAWKEIKSILSEVSKEMWKKYRKAKQKEVNDF